MKTDSLGRRRRDLRQPLKDHVYQVTERDISWLSFIHRHAGRLPTSFLYHHSIHTHSNYTKAQQRLTVLFNELKLLSRPQQQFDANGRHYYHEMIHELSPKGIELLKDIGEYSEYAPSMRGSFPHQILLSCISASFELSARNVYYLYTPQHKILEAVGHDHRIDLDGDKFTPDEVFMLTIDGKNVLIFLEIDRGTEPTESENEKRKSWKRSVAQYKKLIGEKKYKELFGVTCGALLMVVTSSQAKKDGILRAVANEFDGKCNYILVHHIPDFGCAFYLPKPQNMMKVEWARCGHPPFKLL